MDIFSYFQKKGIDTVDRSFYRMIALWESWYKGKVRNFTFYRIYSGKGTYSRKKRKSLGMAKKLSEDIADLLLNERVQITLSDEATHKRKSDTIKKLSKEKFTNKPISKVTRDEVVKYLESLKNYSKSTIKQNYELLCMAFGQAKYENIITDNFMEGYNRVEKPKSEYKSHHRVALTVEEQKKLVDYLNNENYKDCRHKYILLLLDLGQVFRHIFLRIYIYFSSFACELL